MFLSLGHSTDRLKLKESEAKFYTNKVKFLNKLSLYEFKY